jgi:hypothetical protein
MEITNPGLRSARPLTEAFARAKGLMCEASSRWEEHLYVGWEETDLWKGVLVLPYRNAVSVLAQARLKEDRDRRGWGVYHSFGRITPQTPGWEDSFTAKLGEAWEWLGSMDSAAVIAFGEMRRTQLTEEIVPAIRRSADELGMRIAHEYEGNTELVWPPEDEEFHLSIRHSPEQTGITFIGHRRVRRGLFRRRLWVGGCEFDLDIGEWAGPEDLRHRIVTAKGQIERWVPDSDAVQVWVG